MAWMIMPRFNSRTCNRTSDVRMVMMNGSLTDVSEMTVWNRTIVVATIDVIKIAIVCDAVDIDDYDVIHTVRTEKNYKLENTINYIPLL